MASNTSPAELAKPNKNDKRSAHVLGLRKVVAGVAVVAVDPSGSVTPFVPFPFVLLHIFLW